MVDGRSVYNHIFSGVIWGHMDVFMEDIERIEVIRGPGSSVWGANAVNGVINIITKKATDTKGTFVEFGSGNPDVISGGVRHGGNLGDNAAFRIYAKGFKSSNDHFSQPGFEAKTDLDSGMGGFKTDWNLGKSDRFNLQGEIIQSNVHMKEDNPMHPEMTIEHQGWHCLSQWRHTFSKHSKTAWQIYYQREERVDEYQFDTIDLDFQHDYEWFTRYQTRHQFSWGLGYRFITDEMNQGLIGRYTFDPATRDQQMISFFVQDTIQMIPDYLNLTLGSKVEHNDYTGFEIQPGLRMSFTPHERHTFWGAVSRAVRTPSRLDSDSFSKEQAPPSTQGPGEPGYTETRGNEDFDSEDLAACEIGYRTNPSDIIRFDLALFYNVYDNLSAYEKKERGVWVIANDMEGETYGLEVSVDYRPFKWWRLSGVWSYLEMDMRLKDEQTADLSEYMEQTNPQHQLSLHSAFDIGRQVKFDLWLRHVDSIRHMRPRNALNPIFNPIDDYTVFDARLAWKPLKTVEMSVTGRNLGGEHQEFTNYEVEERVFFNVKIEIGK